MKKWSVFAVLLAVLAVPVAAFAVSNCCPTGACCAASADCCN